MANRFARPWRGSRLARFHVHPASKADPLVGGLTSHHARVSAPVSRRSLDSTGYSNLPPQKKDRGGELDRSWLLPSPPRFRFVHPESGSEGRGLRLFDVDRTGQPRRQGRGEISDGTPDITSADWIRTRVETSPLSEIRLAGPGGERGEPPALTSLRGRPDDRRLRTGTRGFG